MTYAVHAYTVVRVKVVNVEATSHAEAIEKADAIVCAFAKTAFRHTYVDHSQIDHCEWAEETVGYLVDEADDPEYDRSVSYRIENGQIDPPPKETP